MFALLIVINMIVGIIGGIYLDFEYRGKCPPCTVYPLIWKSLDARNVNRVGKIIVCVCVTPFTVGLNILLCCSYVLLFVVFLIDCAFNGFCRLFQKKGDDK